MSFNLLDELESMAQFAADYDATPAEVDDTSIHRWQNLFSYTYSEAAKMIEEHRAGSGRNGVSDTHWELVRVDKEAQGYDKESYEHACRTLSKHQPRRQPLVTVNKAVSNYLLKMEGPLQSIDAIKASGCLSDKDSSSCKAIAGTDDSGAPVNFCIVNAATKDNILAWLSSSRSSFQPTFVRYSKADKTLSVFSHSPTLGLDSTLPQNRLAHDMALPLPTQDEYPVWYFFYGTLADPAVLRRLFLLDNEAENPRYRPAMVRGGALTTWGEKYMALVDADEGSIVKGSAFLVCTREHEDALRCFETDKYEVVRCKIEMLDDGTVVKGLVFRFISS